MAIPAALSPCQSKELVPPFEKGGRGDLKNAQMLKVFFLNLLIFGIGEMV